MLRYASNLGSYCGVQQAITVERFAVLDFRRPLGGLRLQLDKVDDGHSTQDGSAFALVFSSDTDAGRSIGGFSRYLLLLLKRLAAWFPYLLLSRPKSALV
jgi:hypothetical protein